MLTKPTIQLGASNTTYLSGTVVLSGGANVTVGTNGQTVTISAADVLSVGASNLGNTAGNTTVNTGSSLVLAGGNNITVSQGTAAGATTLTISGPNAQTAISGIGNSETTYTSGTVNLSVVGGNMTIRSTTGNAFQFSVSQSVQAETQTAISGIANSQTTYTSGTVSLSELGAITIRSTTGNQYQFSVNAQTTQSAIRGLGVSNVGNTAGNTGVSTGVDWVIAGSTNITASQSTAVGGPNTIWLSAAAGGGAGLSAGMSTNGNTSGNTGLVTGQLALAGGNNITLSGSTNGGSMTITVSAPNLGAGAMSAGASNLGNTAGSTGVTGTRLVLVGTGPISLSQSTDANGGTLSISAPSPITQSIVQPWPLGNNSAVAQIGNGTVVLSPFCQEQAFSVSRGDILASISVSSSSNSSHAGVLSVWMGVYTRNASTLSLLSSASQSHQWSNTSNNSMGSISGVRVLSVPFALNNTHTGDLFLGVMSRSSTTNANWFTASNVLMSALTNTTVQGLIGEASNSTKQIVPGMGVFSASSAALPDSIAFTQINGQSNLRLPYVRLVNYTA